ncbi:hypothetical protein FALBO_9762 [Fusarium albosuccineum]|uniref:Uncharacterized protein n=1 Tax=Fusarium albosuccineum TaxID=1237068 RepID=A0A8H4L5P4_9HYPO|nr:hypothetical protein FALBO_9762 [Fusarium albosuccineum]
MAQTSLDMCLDVVAPTKMSMLAKHTDDRLPHLTSPDLCNVSFPQPEVETTRASPSPSTQPYDPDLAREETIVCAPLDLQPTNLAQNDPTEQDRRLRYAPENRSISFDEVFQDGKARVKQIIIQFPDGDGPWFILRCDEHDHNFMYPPFRSAADHLRSRNHGWQGNPSDVAIVKQFGIEVLNCNTELARKNNSAFFRAGQRSVKRSVTDIADGMPEQQTSGSKRPKLTTRDYSRTGVRRQTKQKRREGTVNLAPGRIYLAYREMSRDWVPALLLPHFGLEGEIGIPVTLESLGLINRLPPCYEYDLGTKDLRWKPGYEDGGPHTTEREFPVMYFDGSKFPEGSPADWVRADNLLDFDVSKASLRLVPNLKFARNFLQKRRGKEADAASEGSVILPESEFAYEALVATDANRNLCRAGSGSRSITTASCVVGSHSPIGSASEDVILSKEELVKELFPQETKVPPSLTMGSDAPQSHIQLDNTDRNCHECSPESELGSAPNTEHPVSPDACSPKADSEVMSASNRKEERPNEDQIITLSEPLSVQSTNDTIQTDSGDSTRNDGKGATQSSDPSTSPVRSHQHQISLALSAVPEPANTASGEQLGAPLDLSDPGMIPISGSKEEPSGGSQPTMVNDHQDIHCGDHTAYKDIASSSTDNGHGSANRRMRSHQAFYVACEI